MARRENWFKHDIDSRLGLKMAALFSELGAEGYGVFWIIIETLYRIEGNRLAKASITWQNLELATKSKKVEAVASRCFQLGLFEHDSTSFWSPRVISEIGKQEQHYQELKAKRMAAGQLGGLAKASKASQKRVDKSRSNVYPTDKHTAHVEVRPKVFLKQESIDKFKTELAPGELDYLLGQMADMAQSKPRKFAQYKDHAAVVRSWRSMKLEKGLVFDPGQQIYTRPPYSSNGNNFKTKEQLERDDFDAIMARGLEKAKAQGLK